MEKITFCIPSKNNLEYLKLCIPSIRENAFRNDHDIIVFVDSDNDGTVKWLTNNIKKYNLKLLINPTLNKSLYGIGKAYDECIEKAETDIVMIFHADMVLGENADLHAINLLKPKTAVCSTRIEPPLHPNNGEKILMEFGNFPSDFKHEDFDNFVHSLRNDDTVTEGIFAPWMVYKKDIIEIGGHDHKFNSAREDSDLFNRMHLAGFTFKQSWNSLVYHFTGRGGQFQHNEIDGEKDKEWQTLMENSTKEFIRKWGTVVKHNKMMKPIVSPKYNIGFVVKGCNLVFLKVLEPWCDRIYLEDEMEVIKSSYYEEEQKNTQYDLKERIQCSILPQPTEDIIVHIDKANFTDYDWRIIQRLGDIIHNSGETGIFELGNLKIIINRFIETQNDLINN